MCIPLEGNTPMNLEFSTKEEMTVTPKTHVDHRQIQSIAEIIQA